MKALLDIFMNGGLPFLLATYLHVDVEAYADEVMTIFDLATRRAGR
jgi:hypothetical protein